MMPTFEGIIRENLALLLHPDPRLRLGGADGDVIRRQSGVN
jgi:hypothetical protein